MALGTLAGAVAAAGFASMATTWLATTLVAFAAIGRGRVALHRRWIVLSFALTLSAITLRVSLLVPFFLWFDFMPITAWTSRRGNLVLALLWLSWREGWPVPLARPARPRVAASD